MLYLVVFLPNCWIWRQLTRISLLFALLGEGKEYWKEGNINEEMPACRQMFNIFNPFDPVAYRIEPLICEEVMHKPPVIIPYVSAIGTNYWIDYDTALFMLKHLYRDIAEKPDLSSEELEGSSRSRLKGWCRPREILDEELPLTFADRVFI